MAKGGKWEKTRLTQHQTLSHSTRKQGLSATGRPEKLPDSTAGRGLSRETVLPGFTLEQGRERWACVLGGLRRPCLP